MLDLYFLSLLDFFCFFRKQKYLEIVGNTTLVYVQEEVKSSQLWVMYRYRINLLAQIQTLCKQPGQLGHTTWHIILHWKNWWQAQRCEVYNKDHLEIYKINVAGLNSVFPKDCGIINREIWDDITYNALPWTNIIEMEVWELSCDH